MQFAFYMYVDVDSSVTLMKPGSGTMVYNHLAIIVCMYIDCCFVHVC
jgi:hypothetical protein